MCITTRRGGQGLPLYRINQNFITEKSSHNSCAANRRQSGFTLPELLVSLCILGIVMHGVWQWGTVLYRTSDTMAQNRQAVYLAQQIYAGFSPDCPEGWEVTVASSKHKGMLYETTVQIRANQRQWQFYYAGVEEIVYAPAKNSS